MASFEQYRVGYEGNWSNLRIRPNRAAEAEREARHLLAGKARYQAIEARTGVPYWFCGLCHYRESHFNFDTYLGNGQSLHHVTTIEPKHRGPFNGPDGFVDGAVDALKLEGFIGAKDWSTARTAYRLEGFNGYGYHGKTNSPYLYGGSTLYGPPEARGGKYVKDHDFEAGVVDPQLGTLVILRKLMDIDASVQFGPMVPSTAQASEPDDKLAHGIVWIQHALNMLGADPRLIEDGKSGKATMGMLSAFQRENGLTDTGLADAATIAELEKHLAGGAVVAAPAPDQGTAPQHPTVQASVPPSHTLGDEVRSFLHSIFG